PSTVVCSTRWVPTVWTPSNCGASTTSTRPRTPGPVNPTFWQFCAGSVRGTASDVSTAIAMNRLPSPSAVVAAMLPFTPGGTTCWLAAFAQSAGSNVIPGGRVCGPSSRGSMPVGATLVTLNSDPKLDLTLATWTMSACEKSCSADCPVAHAVSTPALAMTSIVLGFDIAPMYPQVPAQPRNADTVFTNNSAAKSCPSEGFGEPGSLT